MTRTRCPIDQGVPPLCVECAPAKGNLSMKKEGNRLFINLTLRSDSLLVAAGEEFILFSTDGLVEIPGTELRINLIVIGPK